jgi:PKD repeat protein
MLLMINLAAASFEVGNKSHSIKTLYGPEKDLEGWINVSIVSEETSTTFDDNEGNKVKLIDLLESNSDLDYDCTTKNCVNDYQGNNPATSKDYPMGSGDSLLVGIELVTDKLASIKDVNFVVESDNSNNYVSNQLKIDFLDDGDEEIGNDKVSLQSPLTRDYSCFDEESTTISSIPLGYEASSSSIDKRCQLFNFSEAPGFKLNVHIEKGADDPNVTMVVYDENFGVISGSSCYFVADSGSKEYSCDIEYLVMEEEENYVCVYSAEESDASLKGYAVTGTGCGFSSTGGKQPLSAAFNISIQPKKFGPVGEISVQNNLSGGDTLSGIFNEYLSDTYHTTGGDVDCSDGCVIPIKISSYASQLITLKDLVMTYETSSFGSNLELEGNNFYDISTSYAKVTTEGFIEIDLDDAGFTLSDDFGTLDYSMTFEGKDVFDEEIEIEKVSEITGLSPRRTYSAYPTPFRVSVDMFNGSEIVSYKWDFGDDKTGTSSTNEITHTYNETGTYDLEINITDEDGKSSSRVFPVTVGSAEEIINETIEMMLDNLAAVKINLNGFDSFQKARLEAVLDLEQQEDDLKLAQRDYIQASGGSLAEYNQIMGDLLEINIPETVFIETETSSLLFYPQTDKMDLAVLKEVGDGSYDSSQESKYHDAILGWNQANLLTRVVYKRFDAKFEEGIETVLSYFKVDISEIDSLSIDPHLFIEELDDLTFSENHLEENKLGWVHIELTSFPKNVVFSTTEDVSFVDLPMFLAPDLGRLEVLDVDIEDGENNMKWIIFILVILLLLILGVVGYIFLQQWYKKKYERHLFKDQNQLYNLLNYVESSKKKGVDIEEIGKKLKKQGWSSEQITYVTKKHGGKRTGMAEIPVQKVLGMFRKKTSVNKNIPPKRTIPPRNPSFSKSNSNPRDKRRFLRK